MKWPNSLAVIRHGESTYNELKAFKESEPLYADFRKAYEDRKNDPAAARELAQAVIDDGRFTLDCGDHDTPLTARGEAQAEETGRHLVELIDLPDVIFVSPYLRTHQTLGNLAVGWPALNGVKTVEEERIREQDHGLALLYNDWRVFHVMNPDQEALYNMQGSYWYRYPQGENIPDVRERHRSFISAVTRDYAEKNVLMIGHHLSKLSLRANLERLDADAFIDLDEHQKPINCGLTVYRGNPDAGADGHLELDIYNRKLY